MKLPPTTILIIANSESIFKLITIENIYIYIYTYITQKMVEGLRPPIRIKFIMGSILDNHNVSQFLLMFH